MLEKFILELAILIVCRKYYQSIDPLKGTRGACIESRYSS